jgi:hypothetical protein
LCTGSCASVTIGRGCHRRATIRHRGESAACAPRRPAIGLTDGPATRRPPSYAHTRRPVSESERNRSRAVLVVGVDCDRRHRVPDRSRTALERVLRLVAASGAWAHMRRDLVGDDRSRRHVLTDANVWCASAPRGPDPPSRRPLALSCAPLRLDARTPVHRLGAHGRLGGRHGRHRARSSWGDGAAATATVAGSSASARHTLYGRIAGGRTRPWAAIRTRSPQC